MNRNGFKENRTSLFYDPVKSDSEFHPQERNQTNKPSQILIGLILKSSDTYFEDHKQPQSRMTS
ncbi:hypothetical protein LEP1GSC039_2218 [Leptospira santarosai str. 2000027870]|nr:hypothetical protein LEP1GSC039_2218 [Leptospira santarosai str. 2000027870]